MLGLETMILWIHHRSSCNSIGFGSFWDDDHSLLSAFPNSASSVGNLLNALAMAAASTARMASFSACNSINILAISLASPARMGS
uniref:Uncharacterized protein n=1 Tax=Arabidopsis thaliana TaxID=3702 RepID=Q1G370_ARATH|nr:unknown protein [Arabidopsis thaliana]